MVKAALVVPPRLHCQSHPADTNPRFFGGDMAKLILRMPEPSVRAVPYFGAMLNRDECREHVRRALERAAEALSPEMTSEWEAMATQWAWVAHMAEVQECLWPIAGQARF
jgi:hypothetical protein